VKRALLFFLGPPWSAGKHYLGVLRCGLQSFRSLNNLLALGCVVLICAAGGHATTKKPADEKADASPKAQSKHVETVAKSVSKPGTPPKSQSGPKSQVGSTSKSSSSRSITARSKSGKRRVSGSAKQRGQQVIDSDRAREIQQALIRQKYLEGEATGVWDSRTRAAMMRFQSENGWQTKVVPDSRALIKLGLGPKHANLINAEAASGAGLLPEGTRDMHPGGSPPDQ
jgi:hypothetical protein